MKQGTYKRTNKHRLQSIKNLKNGMLGKHHSQDAKDKISKAKKGSKHTSEAKIKISKASKGRIPSIETRKKLSVAQKRRFKLNPRTGANNPNWKSGKKLNGQGYVLIYKPKHPFARQNYVPEHRLVMENIIGRFLKPKERVHHINHIKNDNRPQNLKLFNNMSCHQSHHYPKGSLIGKNKKQ